MNLDEYKRLPAVDVPHSLRLGQPGKVFYAKVTETVEIDDDPDVLAWVLQKLSNSQCTIINRAGLYYIPQNSIVVAKMKQALVYFVPPNSVSDDYVSNANFW